MKQVITIWKKEAVGHATSPRAYVMVALTFAFTALWFFVVNLVQLREASLRGVMVFLAFILLAITPIVTMRTLAEENALGTLEMLLTSPVSELDIVLGKYLGAMTLYVAFFVATLIFPAILFATGNPEHGPLISQYLGLLLVSSAFISVGIFASSVTESQLIAAIISYVLLLAMWVMGMFASIASAGFGAFLKAAALSQHLENFSKGVVDAVDVYYYLAVTALFLFLTWRAVESRRWTA